MQVVVGSFLKRKVGVCLVLSATWLSSVAMVSSAQDKAVAFKIGGKSTTMDSLYKEDQSSFYNLEKQKYDLINGLAREKYLDYFWQKKAKSEGKSVAAVKKSYEDKHIKISDKEVKSTLERFKDHPALKELDAKEQEHQIRESLAERSRRELYEKIIDDAIKSKDLIVAYPEPKEPVYSVEVGSDDHVRYGPDAGDVKPVGCKGNACAITVVEYSEFQCPYCAKVLPDVKRILDEYKGKIRWIVRDFPLNFHDRARPAAVAAKCAAKQGKYWDMYYALFDNQRSLSDSDIKGYAKKIGLKQKDFDNCYAKSGDVEKLINKNYESGVALGVTGTPAFFINGRRLSGAMPYSEFKRIIDDELRKDKKS